MKLLRSILFFVFIPLGCISNGQTSVAHLTCDMAVNPLAVINKQPRLGWQLLSEKLHVSQKAYQILVASSKEKLQNNEADVWDSGKVLSNQSQLINYIGRSLKNETKYFWKVKIWDEANQESSFSEPAFFRMAPSTSELNPTWIGAITKADSYLPEGRHYHTATFKRAKKDSIINASDALSRRSIMLRKPFSISKKIKEAVVYVSGLGHYELSLNGTKIGNSEFAPLWTDYDKSVNYNVYELSENQFQQGENVLGVLLGNGMYNMLAERYSKFFVSFGPPTLFLKMKVSYDDGSEAVINSDESWKYSKSPITFNSLFGGEDYDATLEQKGWDTSNFNDGQWKKIVLQEAPKGPLKAQQAPPITIQKTYSVKEVKEPMDGTYVFNMAQNLSGFPTIKVKGAKGQKVRLWVGEGLKEDGTISQGRSGKPYYFQYTLKGEGVEEWQPKFSYYGYQYIQVDSINYKETKDSKLPTLLEISSNFIYNDAGEAGTFECSNDIFNKAHELINNAIKSNFQAVLTDCPHREKLGWLEEAHLNGPGLIYNYNLQTYIPSIMENIKDAQRENGMIPTIAPEYVVFGGDFTDSPEWGVTGIILPWMYYEYYGDDALIRNYYQVMKRYIDYLTSKSENYILSYGLGDWYDYGEHAAGYSKNSPIALSATSHYYYAAHLFAKAARYLNKTEDIAKYETLASNIKTAYNKEFFNKETKQYGTASQFSNAVSVFMDIVEPQYKEDVMANLLADIKNRGYRLTTGDVGNRYLFQALARNNENEVMYKMNNHYDTPGYGFQIQFGLTTLTEQWDPRKGNSWNHFMMGQIEEWFYRSLAGIVPDETNPGFKHFFIQPELVGDMTFVKASYQSVYGKIVSVWEKKNDTLILNIEIPANTTATVKLPVSKKSNILVNGKNFKKVKVNEAEGKSSLKLGSGVYKIACSL
ncbi:Bacterial alpha-L-rhamnosidase [Mariniflexile rhizosphaerae]|uniref:glycoside hydrolase family 78 protein n=1 Tax=unclassified Mariniflexile TaxID=2643887 RepID=UPI000CC34425|nr:glycoside hydrolase family 78 protein [Mariniflexile sp. TRM1-10]AXP80044.1 Bacterial alpha-L-rhamnosidase [Mariniflexile sp. TRM1-10]PLB20950.1 MAG: Alpha-L-rhamnosidase [Flavobacteriaceae bacterium FS1-H7996/R]